MCSRTMRSRSSRMALVAIAQRLSPQRPHLRGPLQLEPGRPRERGRPELRPQRARGAARQLRVRGRPPRELERHVLYVAVVHGRPGHAELGRPLAVDPLAEERHRGRRLPRAGPAEQGAVAAAGVKAYRQEAGDELGIPGNDTNVGGEGEVEAGAHRAATYRGDWRRLEPPAALERAGARAEAGKGVGRRGVLARGGQGRAIPAGTEEAALAANEHG